MEALVRIVDKVNKVDAKLNELCMKRGDVVHIAEDGHSWSDRERTNPEWRIINLPNDEQIKLSLLALEVKADNSKEYILRRRGVKLNLDALGVTNDATQTRDDTRRTAITAKAQVAAVVQVKTPLPAVDVIGPSDIIGPK